MSSPESSPDEVNPVVPPAAVPASLCQPKSRLTYCILGFLLGEFGVHNFYSGHNKSGIAKIILTLISFGFWQISVPVCIWVGIELLRVKADAAGRPFGVRYFKAGFWVAVAYWIWSAIVAVLMLVWFFIVMPWLMDFLRVQHMNDIVRYTVMFQKGQHRQIPANLGVLKSKLAHAGQTRLLYNVNDPNSDEIFFLVVNGLSDQNSFSMPFLVQKIDKPKDALVIAPLIGGAKVYHGKFQKYSDILPLFEHLPPPDKDLLQKQLQRWDAGDFN